MKKLVQQRMHCPCRRAKILALGLCATCYTLKRQDEEDFGGMREQVLDRDRRRCRVCDAPGGRKRSLAVHHRVAGLSEFDLMITLCLKHHAMVTRTLVMVQNWPSLLIQLWREQHPEAHEQLQLNFSFRTTPAEPVPLFAGEEQAMEMPSHGKPGKRESRFPPFPPLLEARR